MIWKDRRLKNEGKRNAFSALMAQVSAAMQETTLVLLKKNIY